MGRCLRTSYCFEMCDGSCTKMATTTTTPRVRHAADPRVVTQAPTPPPAALVRAHAEGNRRVDVNDYAEFLSSKRREWTGAGIPSASQKIPSSL